MVAMYPAREWKIDVLISGIRETRGLWNGEKASMSVGSGAQMYQRHFSMLGFESEMPLKGSSIDGLII